MVTLKGVAGNTKDSKNEKMGTLRGVAGNTKVSRNGKWSHLKGSLEILKFQGMENGHT